MGILNNVRILVQGFSNSSGHLVGKVNITIRECIDLFITTDKQIGVSLRLEKIGQKSTLTPKPSLDGSTSLKTKPSLDGLTSERQLVQNLPIGSLLIWLSCSIFIFTIIEVLYENRSKFSNYYSNVLIPKDFNESDDFVRNFRFEYLIPVSTFTQKNFIQTLAKKN